MYVLCNFYIVTETRVENGRKKKMQTMECDTPEQAQRVIDQWSDSIVRNEIDGYYLDSGIKLDAYRWTIKESQRLIYTS